MAKKHSGAVTLSLTKYDEAQKEKAISKLNDSRVTYPDFLDFMESEIETSKRMAEFNYSLSCFRDDGVYQLNRAIEEIYGKATAQRESTGPSGGGEAAIRTISVELASGEIKKVPYGSIALAGCGEDAEVNINYDKDSKQLLVTGRVQYKYQAMMDEIIVVTKNYLKTDSIYKNQALEITADLSCPKILKIKNEEFMVLSEKTERELRPLRARLNNPEKCIEMGTPLKYGCLLYGKYGTGKTLLAFKLAQEAIQNNWIFIYLKEPKHLAESLRLSKMIDQSGHGVIVFVEDIDQVVRGDRDTKMQDILNTLDGGDTKDMNVIALFTTNHIELIEPTFLRGKRIGSIITMECLDEKTSLEFIEKSFPAPQYSIILDGMDEVCSYIKKNEIPPAFMAEITEKVKCNLIFEDRTTVTADDIRISVDSYLYQVDLSKTKDTSETKEIRFYKDFQEMCQSPRIVEMHEEICE